MTTVTTQNASGRPNIEQTDYKSFTNIATNSSGNIIGAPVTHEYIATRKSFSHVSVNSPRVKGKLVLKTNPYDSTKIEESRGIVLSQASHPDYGSTTDYFYFTTGGGYTPGNVDTLQSRAVSRARTAFRKEVANAGANILLAVVERREILETLHSLTKGAYTKLLEYKKLLDRFNRLTSDMARQRFLERYISGRSIPGLSKSKDKAADLWLFYVYAIMPLVLEAKALIDHVKKIEPRAAHGRARQSFEYTRKIDDVSWSGNEKYIGYVSCHIRGWITVNDPFKKLLAEFGFTNIATVIYERITYSFVVDWFINLGSWLASLSSLDGVSVSEYSETVTIKNGMSVSGFKSLNWGGYTQCKASIVNPHFFLYKRKIRAVPQQPPMPTLFTGVNLSWQRLLSAVSLLNQRLFRLKS